MSIWMENLCTSLQYSLKRYMQYLAGITFDLSLSLLLLLRLTFSLNEARYVLWEVFHVEVLCTQSSSFYSQATKITE